VLKVVGVVVIGVIMFIFDIIVVNVVLWMF